MEGEEDRERRAAPSVTGRVAVGGLEIVSVVGRTEPSAWKQTVCCGPSANSGEHRSGQGGLGCRGTSARFPKRRAISFWTEGGLRAAHLCFATYWRGPKASGRLSTMKFRAMRRPGVAEQIR